MTHAEKCPVCGGCGKKTEYTQGYSTNTEGITRFCNGCNGKGWITVPDVGEKLN